MAGDGLRVIFLDIDGVICCNRFGRLEEDKLENLRSVVERTGASVVLSTDWRRTPRLKARLCAILAEYGIRVIGATMQGPPQRPVRPREIVSWLEGYETERAKQHQSHAPVSAWVAVDDRFLLFEEDVSLLRHRIKLEQLKDEQRQQLMALEPHNGQVLGRGEGAGAKASALYAAPTPQLSAPAVGVGGAGGPNNENHHTQMEAHSGKDPRRDAHGGYNTPSIYTADRGYTSATGIGGAAPMGAGSVISASLQGGNAGNAASYARAQRFMRRTGSRNGGPPTPTPFQNVKVFDLNVSGAAVGA